jgi:hypothetical protein
MPLDRCRRPTVNLKDNESLMFYRNRYTARQQSIRETRFGYRQIVSEVSEDRECQTLPGVRIKRLEIKLAALRAAFPNAEPATVKRQNVERLEDAKGNSVQKCW